MCGCQKPARDRLAAPGGITDAAGLAVPGGEPLRYRGTRALLVRGPVTGMGYACYPGETIRIHPGDAPRLIATGAFLRDPL